jgi:hypothetical protein
VGLNDGYAVCIMISEISDEPTKSVEKFMVV